MGSVLALDGQAYSAERVSESATRIVESDNKRVWRAIADTAGKSDPERALYWLEKLAEAKHRGRYDTWTAARDRAAAEAGAPISKVKRLWDRWQSMKTVCGSVMVPLMLAYEEMCERNEAAADEYRRERLELRAQRNAADLERAREGVGMDIARC